MRIYKGSEITLKLYTRINCQSIEADKMRVVLFTTNPNNSYMVNNVVVSGDTLLVTVGRNDLNAMEDGVINYIILGYDDNEEIYNSTRQSNYYLKTPDGYVAKSIQTSKDVYIVDNGEYKILPDEDYTSIEEVNVHVEFDTEPYIQRGIELGEANQKAKLESVSITENGTYTREDGYNEITVEVPDLNGSFDEGYSSGYTDGIEYASENAEEIAAANAIDLVATEFGTYYTKYSDNIDIVYPDLITGIYPNGENFYDYANLASSVYNTGIIPTMDCKIEFWYKYTNLQSGNKDWHYIIGSGKEEDLNCYMLKKEYATSSSLWFNWDYHRGFTDDFFTYEWKHIVISYLDGIVVNGVKISEIGMPQNNGNSPFYINGAELSVSSNINGYFGMIKITTDGITNVIIPTADGFKNITTGEMLEIVNDGSYSFVNNTPNANILDNLIKSVDVQPKIDVGKYGIKLGYSTFTEIPSFYDLSNVADMSYMFHYCNSLQTIPELDTSNVTNMSNMFAQCHSLQTIPELDTSNVAIMESMFTNCGSLQTIPELDTSNVTNMNSMFYQSPNFISIPPLNAGKISFNNYNGLFYFTTMNKLTDFGGLIGFKGNANNDYTFVRCPNLTYQSCINILNGLYDFTSNGETPTSSQGKLKVHSNFLTTVGDEISIGINKGWTITA